MEAIWQVTLENLPLLVVPACGFVLALVVLRVKKRYVNEGVLLTRKSAGERDRRASREGNEMNSGNDIDLEIALRKFHELGLEGAIWVMNIGTQSDSY